MRRPVLIVGLVWCGVLLAVASIGSGGCAYDWGFPADETTKKETGGPIDSPVVESSVADSPNDSAVPDALEAGKPCKLSASECAEEEYCKFADRHCGTTQVGVCTVIPKVGCPQLEYVCGCNNTVYKSQCEANAAGQDVSTTAACATMAGTFRCGYRSCNTTKEFCLESKNMAVPEYKCVAFEVSCSSTDCTCTTIKNLGCSGCDQSKPGMVQVTCP